MQMAVKPTHSSAPASSVAKQRVQRFEVISDLESAVGQVEQALYRLRDLAKQPGYEFIGRMIPGYVWAIEQLHELNTGLIVKTESKPDAER